MAPLRARHGRRALDHANHLAAIAMIKMQGGVFGSVSRAEHLLAALA